ncbi:MAG: quinol:cytochrome C oxidoreductase [Flavobacteriales bacterium]|nr:quinol:cytochrome C oxidoreductase [Flavobacteriales bacterium]
MEFQISDKAKKVIFGTIGVGLVAFIIGAIMDSGSEQFTTRLFSNFLIDGFFFFAIALGALFFLALQYATETAWSVMIKRIVEGVASYVIVGIGVLAVLFLVITLMDGAYTESHGHHVGHIYAWMDSEIVEHDALIAGKAPFLTKWFFWMVTIIYFATYFLFYRGFRKRSLQEDIEGGTKIHMKNYAKGALFLVLFGYFSSTSSWHWIMSIDAHWFSTLFGWYVFGGMWCTAMTTIMLVALYLKKKGYLEKLSDHHIHDIGKWIFATSFLWSYLFFSQFMLYWYADIPEEVIYYHFRFEHYKVIYWGMFMINFIIPMVILMSREAKRNAGILAVVCLIIIIGHWTDVYMLITPGTMGEFGNIGLIEIGLFLTFAGIFTFFVLNTLTKAPLVPKNHPYLDESKHHEI